jgi:hypothetical protein
MQNHHFCQLIHRVSHYIPIRYHQIQLYIYIIPIYSSIFLYIAGYAGRIVLSKGNSPPGPGGWRYFWPPGAAIQLSIAKKTQPEKPGRNQEPLATLGRWDVTYSSMADRN